MSRVSAEPAGAATPDQIRQVRRLVDGARRIVVLTGAGISTDCGIPDFRGPNGRLDEEPQGRAHLRTSTYYVADPEVRRLAWQGRLHHPVWQAAAQRRPPGARRARAARQPARCSSPRTSTASTRRPAPTRPWSSRSTAPCARSCAWSAATGRRWRDALDRVRAGRGRPAVPRCGGILKSATISFGQTLVADDLERAVQRGRARPTCCSPSARRSPSTPSPRVPEIAAAGGAPVVIVNAEPTAFDDRGRRGAPRPDRRDPAGAPGLTGRPATV